MIEITGNMIEQYVNKYAWDDQMITLRQHDNWDYTMLILDELFYVDMT